MDSESAASREKGAWDAREQLAGWYEAWSSDEATPDFVVDEAWRGTVARLGFSGSVAAETVAFWDATLRAVYSGDEGRRKLRVALINLLERDGLLLRLRDIRCPVYWLQVRVPRRRRATGGPAGRRRRAKGRACVGWADADVRAQGSEDAVFTHALAEAHIRLFSNAREARLESVDGGGHYLNATSPNEVAAAVLSMVSKYKDGGGEGGVARTEKRPAAREG